jgi:hypothetical protein
MVALQGQSEDVEGKLVCPKCTTRVGSLKWAGTQCSCKQVAALDNVTMTTIHGGRWHMGHTRYSNLQEGS